jgi:ubiquinone biosynthesis accessory factor UbiJ
MSFALLQTALLLPFEATLNGLLALDAASSTRLKQAEGATLGVHSTAPTLQLFIHVRQGKLKISPVFEGIPTASLHGSSTALLGLLLQQHPVHSLAPHGIELRGSTAFVQTLQDILKDLDIDWEFHMSRLLGDLPTAAFSSVLAGTKDYVGLTTRSMRQGVDDYLAHENPLLLGRPRFEAFQSALLQLSLRLDRLQARVDLAAGQS